MALANIVFLIDVNGIPRDSAILNAKDKGKQLEGGGGGGATDDGNQQQELQNESMEMFPFDNSKDLDGRSEEWELDWLTDFVLLTLFKEANNGREYDFSRVNWSFKFFDSSHHVDYRDGRAFMPFDNESFRNFEAQLNLRMKPTTSSKTCSNLPSSAVPNSAGDAYTSYDSSRIKFLSDAIKIITGSLPWSEGPELNFSKSFNATGMEEEEPITKNTVYAFVRVPRSEKHLEDFADLQGNSSTKDFMKVLLPLAFSSQFHHKLRIQLNFVDMWGAPQNSSHCYVPDWNNSYPRQIVKCLQYLGNGRVHSIPISGSSNLLSATMSLGLIPYPTFLRQFLQQASQQNENVPSHIQKLAPGAVAKALLKNSQKISPELGGDTDSVSRSFRSGLSVMEASYNSQNNKVLRPFRLSAGFDEDDKYEFVRHHKIQQDRMIGGGALMEVDNRKRKRYEYDSGEDYYTAHVPPTKHHHHHHRHHEDHHSRRYSEAFGGEVGGDDGESDSVDVDSQCERDQRLENWVNDGVFSAKRKKHVTMEAAPPPTKTVPMSRPALSKSFHVFHEPAPKLPGSGSRSKKMLATVERQKFRSSVVESKRRSSGGGAAEGLMDIKRITQKQEKELSAIKRRLKTYLEGELDGEESDPICWVKKLKKELRGFADMILQEEEPCLVALAQALVNCASVKFTPQIVKEIREVYRRPSITAKDLLEQLLLSEQTNLNMRIINAQKMSRGVDKLSPGGSGGGSGSSQQQQQHQKMLTFRETELQIILRLEIAWCFFIEPDEEAMEDLLQEVISLLQLIAAYRTTPPIEYFVNTVLLPTYSQSSRFMRGLYKKMNLPLPTQLAMDGSPVPNNSRRDDDSSIISSTSSANLYPEDSASQLHFNKRRRSSPAAKRHVAASAHAHTTHRKVAPTGSKKAKRQIMVASSNPSKLPVSQQFMMDRTDSQKKGAGVQGNKVSPKRVRRNLFDVQKKDKRDSKTLLTLASSSSRLAKSPAFKSPKAGGKSPLSPSGTGFFRAVRGRRQLVMGMNSNSQPSASAGAATDRQFGSPSINNDILCPESPATPGGALSVTSKYAPTSTSGSIEKHRVIIQESPEVQKNDYDNRPMGKVASLSFYSTGAPRSRAWEKSETQLQAARIKESVDLRSKELTLSLSDFSMLPISPDEKTKSKSTFSRQVGGAGEGRLSASSADTPRTNLSFCADSYIERTDGGDGSPMPCTSSSDLIQHLTGPAPDLDNPNIEALINSKAALFPLLQSKEQSCENDLPLQVGQTDPLLAPQVTTTTTSSGGSGSPCNINLQTPSKRVQFNLNENLVNTPSSARRNSTGTPKSILKETHDTTL